MRAINNYIVVEKKKDEPKKVAGLIVNDATDVDNRYVKATILTKGNLVEGVEVGDTVYYDKHAGHGIQWNDTLYHVIRVQDVVLVEWD